MALYEDYYYLTAFLNLKLITPITAVLLIVLLLSAHQSTYWLGLKLEQWHTRTTMHRQIQRREAGSIQFISVSTQDLQTTLHWENDHEFLLDGEMCDVVQMQEANDSIHIQYIVDHRETEIKKKLGQLEDDSEESQKQSPGKQLKLPPLKYLSQPMARIVVPTSSMATISRPEPGLRFFNRYSPPPSPPPEVS